MQTNVMEQFSVLPLLLHCAVFMIKIHKRDVSETKEIRAAALTAASDSLSYKHVDLEQIVCSTFCNGGFNHFSVFRTCMHVSEVLDFHSGQCSRTYVITKIWWKVAEIKSQVTKQNTFSVISLVRAETGNVIWTSAPQSAKNSKVLQSVPWRDEENGKEQKLLLRNLLIYYSLPSAKKTNAQPSLFCDPFSPTL